jgi:hypothetical protein
MRFDRLITARLALVVGLAVLVGGIFLTLSSSANTVSSNGTRAEATEELASTTVCQYGPVPRATTAVRPFFSDVGGGPAITVTLKEGSKIIASGRHAAGWTGTGVEIALDRPASLSRRGLICFGVAELPVEIMGEVPNNVAQADSSSLRMSVEYISGHSGSWLARARTVVRHFGLGRPASGAVLAALALLAMVTAGMLTVVAAIREVR